MVHLKDNVFVQLKTHSTHAIHKFLSLLCKHSSSDFLQAFTSTMCQHIYIRLTVCGHAISKTVDGMIPCQKHNCKEAKEDRGVGEDHLCSDMKEIEETVDSKCNDCVEAKKRRETLAKIFIGESTVRKILRMRNSGVECDTES